MEKCPKYQPLGDKEGQPCKICWQPRNAHSNPFMDLFSSFSDKGKTKQ